MVGEDVRPFLELMNPIASNNIRMILRVNDVKVLDTREASCGEA